MDDNNIFNRSFFQFIKPFLFSYKHEHGGTDIPSQNNADMSPRDSMLKPKEDSQNFSNEDGNNVLFYQVPEEDQFDSQSSDFFHTFDSSGFDSIFDTFDQMFKDFMPFHSHGEFQQFPDFNDPGSFHFQPQPRIEDGDKKDKDLDNFSNTAMQSLLKQSPPSFEYGDAAPSGLGPPASSPPSAFPSKPTMRFKTTSIVRIRKSDGSIEERREYRDSDGREQVDVTTSEPDPYTGSGLDGGLLKDPFQEPMFKGGLFSQFLKRFGVF